MVLSLHPLVLHQERKPNFGGWSEHLMLMKNERDASNWTAFAVGYGFTTSFRYFGNLAKKF